MLGIADNWDMYGSGVSFDLYNNLIFDYRFFFLGIETDKYLNAFLPRNLLVGKLYCKVGFAWLNYFKLSGELGVIL